MDAARLAFKKRVEHVLDHLRHNDGLTNDFVQKANEEIDALSEVCAVFQRL